MAQNQSQGRERRGGQSDFMPRLAAKLLMPIVATAASAVAGYAAKRGPKLFQESVLPRLRKVAAGAGDAAQDLPSRAKSVASSAGDVALDLAERAKSAATGAAGTVSGNGRVLSADELKSRRTERAAGRARRRGASTR
jgi:hypothetical protein